MAKILFIDTWRAGLFYTDRVVEALSSRHKAYYLHFESLVMPYLPQNRREMALKTYRDRSANDVYYAGIFDHDVFGNSIASAIETIDPSVVVFIAVHNFPARWGNLVSVGKSIPTLHFMHGVNVRYAASVGGGAIEQVRKLYYNLKRAAYYVEAFRRYAGDARKLDRPPALVDLLAELYELIFRHHKYDFSPTRTYNVKYNTLCLISDQDRSYFKQQYGMSDETRMVVSGHIDLVKILDRLKEKNDTRAAEKNVLFVSQPYVAEGAVSKDTYQRAIETMHRFARSVGLEFVVRLHPREERTALSELEQRGIAFSEGTLEEDLHQACLVIGSNSTVLSTASQLALPVLTVVFPGIPPAVFLDDYDIHAGIPVDRLSAREEEIKTFMLQASRMANALDFSTIPNPVDVISEEIELLIEEPAGS